MTGDGVVEQLPQRRGVDRFGTRTRYLAGSREEEEARRG